MRSQLGALRRPSAATAIATRSSLAAARGLFSGSRRALGIALLAWRGLVMPANSAEVTVTPGQAALQELRTFATTGRVLHVGAHPDDENTQLIAYLSRGRGYDTAYLSITRGDGGQNLLGPQFDEKLGVARTQELLAARRIDGGRQYFTRAIDFGFSKTPDETLSIWNHREVLGDVVRVIREFRPDVIITRFPIPPGSGGHGHHTASAILAVEAFKLAGNPQAYPEQLQDGLKPWQPKRIVWNGGGFFRGSALDQNPTVRVDIGGQDPVTGESFGSIAGRSRSMHKTQGFGNFGGRISGGPRIEPFVLLAGDAPQKDFMDGVDTSWAREPGGAEIGARAEKAIAAFDVAHPEASVPALLALRQRLATLPVDVIVADKRQELDGVLRRCLGLTDATNTDTPDIVPGEQEKVSATVTLSAHVPVRWVAVDGGGTHLAVNADLSPGVATSRSLTYAVGTDVPVTQPYWLRIPPTTGMYRVTDPKLIGRPENPPELPVRYTFSIDGQEISVSDQLTYAPAGARSRHVVVIPPVSLSFRADVAIFRPGEPRRVMIEATSARPNVTASVALEVPPGWRASPPVLVTLAKRGAAAQVPFTISAPNHPNGGSVLMQATVDGRNWTTTTIRIEYAHIPPQLLQPTARLKVACVDVATRGHAIGYLPGAGDDVPQALEQLGYKVTTLSPGDITADRLAQFDSIVIGVRAFNTRDDLPAIMPLLDAFVQHGGTVVAQYNWSRNLKTNVLAPYPLALSDRRVTNEDAPVTILDPAHPALTVPNKITAADFAGWVQERGIYFPSEWDGHFTPLLQMSDPGEPPLQGALLVAPYGKGYYVYTSLVFFRELPAGVPGAYRLFANLVSLGK